MARTITWNPTKLKALIAARNAAIERREVKFTVTLPDEREPAEFLVNYAGHLIGYLENEFAANPPRDFGPNNEGKEGE